MKQLDHSADRFLQMHAAADAPTVTSHHADGSVATVKRAVSKKKANADYKPGTWHVRLEDGKQIVGSESWLDLVCNGWRTLPDAS